MTMELKNIDISEYIISSKKELFYEQKKTLDTFLSRGAITKAQYEKSLGDLSEKMGCRA